MHVKRFLFAFKSIIIAMTFQGDFIRLPVRLFDTSPGKG
jgi:hypothetical protein